MRARHVFLIVGATLACMGCGDENIFVSLPENNNQSFILITERNDSFQLFAFADLENQPLKISSSRGEVFLVGFDKTLRELGLPEGDVELMADGVILPRIDLFTRLEQSGSSSRFAEISPPSWVAELRFKCTDPCPHLRCPRLESERIELPEAPEDPMPPSRGGRISQLINIGPSSALVATHTGSFYQVDRDGARFVGIDPTRIASAGVVVDDTLYLGLNDGNVIRINERDPLGPAEIIGQTSCIMATMSAWQDVVFGVTECAELVRIEGGQLETVSAPFESGAERWEIVAESRQRAFAVARFTDKAYSVVGANVERVRADPMPDRFNTLIAAKDRTPLLVGEFAGIRRALRRKGSVWIAEETIASFSQAVLKGGPIAGGFAFGTTGGRFGVHIDRETCELHGADIDDFNNLAEIANDEWLGSDTFKLVRVRISLAKTN